MPIRLTDFLAGPNRGTASQALAYAVTQRADRQVFLAEYFTELYRLCAKYQLDAAILVAQSANETGKWKSAIWNQYGNPAGIGVTGTDTSTGTNYSLVYKNGKDAARAHVVHMQAYVRGAIPAGTELHDYIDLDPRYNAVFQANYDRTITRIQDFNVNGRWALLNNPPPYGTRIVNDGLSVWPGLPDQDDPPVYPAEPEEPIPMPITFGKVPHPKYTNRIIANSGAWADQGQRTIRAAVWHRMYGSLWGTDGYFRGEAINKALTDYGVGVAATDGEANAGAILMWNDPNGRRAPHASGPVSDPIGDGAKFVEYWPINRDSVSIEVSGLSGGTAFDAKARKAVVELTAYYADRYGKLLAEKGIQFDYTNWPYVPHEDDRSFVIWHGEVNGGKRGTCPGAVVESQTAAMIAEVGALLKQYQADGVQPAPIPDPVPPPSPAPEIVPGVDWGIAYRCFGESFKDQGLVLTKGGPLSTLYLAHCKATGEWPALTDYWPYEDKRRYFRFSNGWLALDPPGADAPVHWIEEAA
jgi:hypothetical protein